MVPPAPADAPSTVGDGRFEVTGFLGEGVRKRVYLANDRHRDGAQTAVSVFSTEGLAATAQSRARHEIEAVERLGEHPRVVSVLASGQDDTRPYIASEYMPGGDLGDLLASTPGRRLPVARAIAIASEIAAGLEHAHGRGIVHRDIKPANVWLDSDGSARIGDFGLAASTARSREAVQRMVVGTAAYLPPEQAIGRRTDERADLYTLGALLYEMLTGEPPFPGDDPVSIISRHLSAEPLPPSRHAPEVPGALDSLVLRLLAKPPQERPRSATEVREELDRIDPEAAAGEEEREGNPLDDLARGIFVGRERELDALRELAERTLAGRGGVALIEGEPGIGKTRLTEELVTYARVRGALVLTSACYEADAAPSYWPFAQALRAWVRDADPVGLAWQLGGDGPEIARLLPELIDRVPSIERPPPIEGDESRFRFFEAVADTLTGISRSRPLVLVLDDLHWADASSVELLRFLAHRIADDPLLVVCAYRGEEAAARGDLARTLAELGQVAGGRRLELAGLDREAIGRFVELTTGEPAAPELVEEIAEQTGGNPFFVAEVVRLIATAGDLGAPRRAIREVPHGVREAVSRRIGWLPERAREALEVASVIGREFDASLLGDLIGPAEAELEQARAARIIERRGRAEGLYLFSHAVFREALYEGLGAARRAELHLRAVAGIERRYGDELGPKLPALARHSFESAGLGSAEKALGYSLAAARQAAGRLAHADAAEHLERALEVLPSGEPAEELELRLELAEEMIRCGRFGDARSTLMRCAELAREIGDGVRLAEAAVALGSVSDTGASDRDLISLCEEALEAVGEGSPALSSRLLSVLAQEHYWGAVDSEARELSDRAIELARRSGDDRALALALRGRQFIDVGRPGMVGARLENARELLEVARRAGDRSNEARAHAYILHSRLQAGDVAAADRALADYTALAQRLGEPRHLWHVPMIRAMRAIMRGRFAEAQELSAEGARLGALAEEPLAGQLHVVQMAAIHSVRGSPEEMLPLIRRMIEDYPAIPAWRLALVGFLVEADRIDEARDEFEPIAAAGFDSFPRDANWLTGLARISEAAARLGDERSCRDLIGRLSGFEGEVIVTGRGALLNGPIERYLGMMSAAIGDHERAIGHLEAAIARCEQMGERPLRAETRLQLGRALLARDGGGDRDRALEEVTTALEQGQAMGMRKLVERAVRTRLEAQGVADVGADASIDSVALAVSGERPDLGSFASSDGRVTILFSDIENSTLINERLGDDRWVDVLRAHNAVFRRRLGEHGGYEVKNQGDGFMLAFPDPLAALACATAVQRDLASGEGSEAERVRVRIGIHVGEAIQEEGDLFGRSVVLAARIAAQARGGEILASEALRDAGADAVGFDDGRELELKGLSGTHRVFRADWRVAGRPVPGSGGPVSLAR